MPRRSRHRGILEGRGSTAPFRIARLIGMGGGCLGSFRASLVYGFAERVGIFVAGFREGATAATIWGCAQHRGADPKLQGCKARSSGFVPADLCRPARESPLGCPNTTREGVGGGIKSLEKSKTPDRCKITFGDFFVQERIFAKPPIFRTFFSVGGYAVLRLSGPKTGLWTLFFSALAQVARIETI